MNFFVGRWYALAALVFALDWLTKHMASSALRYGEPVVITEFFNLTLLHNPGAAFSFLSQAGGWQRWFFAVIAAGVGAFIILWLYRLAHRDAWQSLGLSLVLGGALGNLWDRVALGYVVDFVQLHYHDYYWPAFNVADSGITLGAAVLIINSLFGDRERARVARRQVKVEGDGK